MKLAILLSLILATSAVTAFPAKPPSLEEVQRQAAVVAELQDSFAAEATAPGKLAVMRRWLRLEQPVEVRSKGLEYGNRLPQPELDTFFSLVLKSDEDAGLRSEAAKLLGRFGSEKCLAALAHAAANDATTDCLSGCILFRTSARRPATFAIAELAGRFPNLQPDAVRQLKDLKPVEPQDGEQLADARAQALYQVTRDAALLAPFLARLQSADPKTRESGVVAFRFFQLKVAPPELIATLQDNDENVRLWSALVLGEIGDPKTAPLLLGMAQNVKQEYGVRCNALHSLGRMRAESIAPALRKLLDDENGAIQTQAAIALYRITGDKVKQFPEGYKTNGPQCE